MANAAIYFHPDGFDTRSRLMGRQAAGESFLRGFLRHADADRFYFYNAGEGRSDQLEALVRGIEPLTRPTQWIPRGHARMLAEAGCLFISAPANAGEAWNRRLSNPSGYSICGLTHTTCSQGAMDGVIAMLHSPVEPWDALICTSPSVKASVSNQLGMAMDYFRERFGPAVATPEIRLETIPLGVNTDDYARSERDRVYWRERLGVEEDGLVVLFVGRFAPHAKMNPVPMAMALERVAQRTRRPIHWVLAGWAPNDALHEAFVGSGRRYAPSVKTHALDGRLAEVRFPIWSAGDIFFSLSDNIQETFGLTPVEAMAAGLPSVISDWDGYRETIRHGVEGFRVPTLAPRPGQGGDLAVAFGNGWLNYDYYIGIASHCAAVDLDGAEEALLRLVDDDGLRLRMGAAALQRARSVYDWKTVVGQYQALWSDLAEIRTHAARKPSGPLNPWRPDPFTLYASYPTRPLAGTQRVALVPGVTLATVRALLEDPTVSFAAKHFLSLKEFGEVLEVLATRGTITAADVAAALPPARRDIVARSLLWMAKMGIVRFSDWPDVATA